MFVGSLSGGLVALGLVAAAAHIGTVFYAFGLIVLPTFAIIGLVTFQRALQSGVEELGYGRRIARLRAYCASSHEFCPHAYWLGDTTQDGGGRGAGDETRTRAIQLGRNGVKQPLTHKDFRARMTEDTKTSGCSIRAE
jgi:hypothetical protein